MHSLRRVRVETRSEPRSSKRFCERLGQMLLLGLWLIPASIFADDPAEADPLQSLNAAFRTVYDESRQKTLTSGGPILLLMGDTLTLVKGDSRQESQVTPATYHQLKTISHAALGVYVLLTHQADGELADDDVERLQTYRQRIVDAQGALALYDFGPNGSPRQQQLLEASSAYLGELLESRQFTAESLTAFARRVEPWLLENAEEAARLQIDGIHAQVQVWKQELSDEEWASLKAVVVGSQLPRKGSLGVQYFARLLGEKGEGRRIIYAESLFDADRALRLAGTHALDRRIAVAFFDDDERMHRDLLADATTRYLDQLFP